jgi:hypothetical protein
LGDDVRTQARIAAMIFLAAARSTVSASHISG